MKNLFLLILFALTVNTSCAQWSVDAYRSDIAEIEIIDKDTLIMIGAKGEITRTTKGGGNFWSTTIPFPSFRYSWFSDIHFPTKKVGYISGGSYFGLTNILIKTIDGGQTWDSLSSGVGAGNFINKIHFLDKDTGFLIADDRQILKTVDGGITRSQIGSTSLALYSDFIFTDNHTGFFATTLRISSTEFVYKILKTTDYAQTFTTVYIDSMSGANGFNNRVISKIQFIDNMNGFAVGGGGIFMKTTDGGNTWSRSFLTPFNQLTSVHFVNPTTGYVNNAGGIYKTTDAGSTWNVQQINSLSTIHSINFVNDTLGFAAGASAVYKTINAGNFVGLKENKEEIELSIYPNPTSGIFSIEIKNSELNYVRIYDVNGREIKHSITNSSFDISAYSSGIYILEIGTNKGVTTKRIVKK